MQKHYAVVAGTAAVDASNTIQDVFDGMIKSQ